MSGRILTRLRSPRSAPWLRLTRVPALSALSFASGFVVLTVPGPWGGNIPSDDASSGSDRGGGRLLVAHVKLGSDE